MYIRFVTGEVDPDSLSETGVFQAAYRLRNESAVYEYEETFLSELLKWFDENLEAPNKFTTSKPPHYRKKNKAISWFKESAAELVLRNVAQDTRRLPVPAAFLSLKPQRFHRIDSRSPQCRNITS